MSLKKSGRISSEEKRIEKIDDVLGLSVDEKDSSNYETDDLDFTTEDLDLTTVDEDIMELQKHPQIAKVFEEGGDLRTYTNQNEAELSELEWGTLQDYIAEGETIAKLYYQICECDKVLESFETLLSTFKTDLSNIGTEIKHLQDECLNKELRIKNRKEVTTHLGDFMQGIYIDKELKEKLLNDPINEQYMDLLHTFNKKIVLLAKPATSGPKQ
jgi:hypothetical protein